MSEEIKFQKLAPMPPIKLLKLLVKMGVKPPTPQVPYPENWSSLSGDEKYEFFKKFNIATEHRAFVSEEKAQTYQRRMHQCAVCVVNTNKRFSPSLWASCSKSFSSLCPRLPPR